MNLYEVSVPLGEDNDTEEGVPAPGGGVAPQSVKGSLELFKWFYPSH